jgi:hypothetical protein
MLKETKMKKVKAKLKENYSFSQTDTERLVDGNFNISKIEDPIEFKRLNNYIAAVASSNAFNNSQSRKDALIQLRTKLNLLGFDIDVPAVQESGDMTLTLPLKRFGGIKGVDDMGQKLDNPYGPGAKFDLEVKSSYDILTARVIPAVPTGSFETSSAAELTKHPKQQTETPVAAPAEVKEGFSFAAIKNFLFKK